MHILIDKILSLDIISYYLLFQSIKKTIVKIYFINNMVINFIILISLRLETNSYDNVTNKDDSLKCKISDREN